MKSISSLVMDHKRDWFIPLVALMLIWILAARSPLDSDIWWHLRAGQTTLLQSHPLVTDLFSYTRLGQSWINHSWLSEVVLYLAFQAWGYLGLELWVVVLATASLGFVYLQLSGAPIVRAFYLILGSTVAALVWSPRPQLMSLFFFSVVGYLLFLKKYKQSDFLWLLPVIFVLWGNFHGGYPLGFLLIGAMVAGELLNHLLQLDYPERLPLIEIGKLVRWSLLSFLVLVINPNGFNIWRIPFQTVEVGSLQQFIQEWASPDFHEVYQQPYLFLLFLLVLAVGLAGRRTDGSDLVTASIFGVMGLVAQRNFGPFALAALPIISRAVSQAFKTWRAQSQNDEFHNLPEETAFRQRPRWQMRLNLVIIGFLALVGFGKLALTANPVWMDSLVASQNPAQAVAWLKQNHPPGQLLNEYNWGGYLVWTLPEYPVFVDGRTDLFGDEIISQWIEAVQAGPNWKQILERWKINLVLVNPQRPIVAALEINGWKRLYSDEICVLLGR